MHNNIALHNIQLHEFWEIITLIAISTWVVNFRIFIHFYLNTVKL